MEEQLQSALSRHGGETSSDGSSGLVRLKGAIKQIKGEVHDMDMSINLLNSRLLALRIADQKDAVQAAARKSRDRHSKKAGVIKEDNLF